MLLFRLWFEDYVNSFVIHDIYEKSDDGYMLKVDIHYPERINDTFRFAIFSRKYNPTFPIFPIKKRIFFIIRTFSRQMYNFRSKLCCYSHVEIKSTFVQTYLCWHFYLGIVKGPLNIERAFALTQHTTTIRYSRNIEIIIHWLALQSY